MTSIDSALSSVIQAKEQAARQQAAYAVAKKSLDMQEFQGQAAAQLVEAAAQLGKAIGKGAQFDGQA